MTSSRESLPHPRLRRARVELAALVTVLAAALTSLALVRTFSLSLFLVAFGTAFAAYLRLVPRLRLGALPLGAAVLLALMIRAPWLAAPPALSDDVWRYLHDGRAQVAGVNPYRYAPAAPEALAYAGPEHPRINQPDLPTIYPPAAQLVFRAAASLGATLLAWKILLLVFDLGIGLAVALVLARRGGPPGAAAVYLLHPLPVIEFAGNGHMDAIGILGLVLGLALLERRPWAAGIGFAVSIAGKYLALPVVPFAARFLPGRRRAAFLTAGLVALALLYAPFADHPPLGSLGTFVRTFEFNASLYGVVRVVTSPVAARAVLAALLIGLLVLLWRARTAPEPAALAWIGGLLLASPIVHPWYVVWLVPFLAWRREAWALAWSGTVVLSYAVLPRWLAERVWELPAWVPWVEYGPVLALLAMRLRGKGSRALE